MKNNLKKYIIIIVSVVLIVGGGVLLYFKNKDNKEETKEIINNNDKQNEEITDIDSEDPILKLKELKVYAGDKFTINDFVDSCTDNSGEECILSYKENKSYSDVGVYDIVIIAKDSSGNETEETTKLEIKTNK